MLRSCPRACSRRTAPFFTSIPHRVNCDMAPLTATQANARLLLDGARGQIIHDAAGSLRPVVCLADRSYSIDGRSDTERPVVPTAFELVSLYQRWIGLRSAGVFLCAEPDGRVTLSRETCSSWESFFLSESHLSLQKDR